jgi:hypothetical protein
MKKVFAIVLAIVLLASLGGVALAKSPKTEFDANGPHFNLNLIAKDKEMPGDYDNPNRHTMFVPLDTDGMLIPLLKGPMGNKIYNHGSSSDNQDYLPGTGIRIDVTQGAEFMVIDGNATRCEEGEDYLDGALQIGPGTYDVYIAVRAKSPHYVDPSTTIDGWVEGYEVNGQLWWYINAGSVTVKKNTGWENMTDLFFIDQGEDPFGLVGSGEGTWVFTYMDWLDAGFTIGDVDYNFSDLAYFWQFDNHGNKLINIRFYPRD